jgi:hypothetical protein
MPSQNLHTETPICIQTMIYGNKFKAIAIGILAYPV